MKSLVKKMAAIVMGITVLAFASPMVMADGKPAATITTKPKPIEGIYDDGQFHDLVHPGVASGGYMVYSLDGVTYFTTLPGATAAGEYTVYYKAIGDNDHSDSIVETVVARITRPETGAFVDYLYMKMMNIHADEETKTQYTQLIYSGGNGGDIARSLFSGSLFTSRNLSDSDFIEIVYSTLFGRIPDTSGKAAWSDALAHGMPRMDMVEEFIQSSEFSNICLAYGLTSGGGASANVTVVSSTSVNDFVGRLYRKCLGRRPDITGRQYWSSQLQNHAISGTNCAYGFFFSPEFINANHSNQEFVTILYEVFLDREPDAAGLNNWLTVLNSGRSRQDVFYGFASSAEFGRICTEYGIIQG
ncbi:MAG: DUF4214 domain-containing protein [Clostridiales bacterium]|nr:DUF4214 domain-containing protein [Clostridiales bacterium]